MKNGMIIAAVGLLAAVVVGFGLWSQTDEQKDDSSGEAPSVTEQLSPTPQVTAVPVEELENEDISPRGEDDVEEGTSAPGVESATVSEVGLSFEYPESWGDLERDISEDKQIRYSFTNQDGSSGTVLIGAAGVVFQAPPRGGSFLDYSGYESLASGIMFKNYIVGLEEEPKAEPDLFELPGFVPAASENGVDYVVNLEYNEWFTPYYAASINTGNSDFPGIQILMVSNAEGGANAEPEIDSADFEALLNSLSFN